MQHWDEMVKKYICSLIITSTAIESINLILTIQKMPRSYTTLMHIYDPVKHLRWSWNQLILLTYRKSQRQMLISFSALNKDFHSFIQVGIMTRTAGYREREG